MKTKSPFNAHINQLADHDNNLRVDNIEIFCEISKNGEYLIARSALEYTIEETETETIEGEEEVDLKESLHEWVRPINPPKLVKGAVAVLCNDNIWRPLVWIENGKGCCFNPS